MRGERKATDATALHTVMLGGPGRLWKPGSMGRPSARELIKRNGRWVHRCVGLNAQTAASVPLRLFAMGSARSTATKGLPGRYPKWGGRPVDKRTRSWLESGEGLQPSQRVKAALQGNMDDLTELTKHPLLDLLNDVNPWDEGFSWRESLMWDLQLFGRAFWLLVGPSVRQPPSELWRLPPQDTEPQAHPVQFVSHYEVGHGMNMVRYEPEEVVWFRLADQDNPWGGLGPLEAWLKSIDADFAMVAFQEWLLNRGGTPDVIVSAKEGFGPDQKSSFIKQWRQRFGRLWRRQDNVMLVDGDVSVDSFGGKPRDMEYQAGREWSRDETANAFGVPKALLTSDDINRANAREASPTHMRYTIWPMLSRVEDKLNQRLVPLFSDRLVLMFDNPIQDDKAIRIQDRESQLRSGYTVNEIRSEDGKEPLDDPMADEPLVQAGLVPLSLVGMTPLGGLEGPQDAADGPADQEGESDDQQPDGTEIAAKPELVLTGGQITAATGIIQAVANGDLPRDSGIGQLQVMFNLDAEQAELMMGTVGDGFEQDRPEPPPAPPPGQPQPPDEPAVEPDDGTPPAPAGSDGQERAISLKAWLWGLEDPDLCKDHAGEAVTDTLTAYENPDFAQELREIMGKQASRIAARLRDTKQGKSRIKVRVTSVEQFLLDTDIELWELELADVASRHITSTLEKMGTEAIAAVGVEAAFDLANTRARDYIANASRRIGRDATDSFRKQLRAILERGIETGRSTSVIATEIQAVSEQFLPFMAERIARTETAYAALNGTEQGWQQSGVVKGKQFVLSPDPCPWCESVANSLGSGRGDIGDSKTTPLGQAFDLPDVITGTFTLADGSQVERHLRIDYSPDDGAGLSVPAVHPGCRCSLRPILHDE